MTIAGAHTPPPLKKFPSQSIATKITLGISIDALDISLAEGVETAEQSRLLHLLGCDEMQGFLFSKPVPAETFEARFLTPPSATQLLG